MLLWLGLLWFVGLLIDLVGCRCADFLRFSLWLIWLAFGGVAFSLLGFTWGGCGWMACLFCFGLVVCVLAGLFMLLLVCVCLLVVCMIVALINSVGHCDGVTVAL